MWQFGRVLILSVLYGVILLAGFSGNAESGDRISVPEIPKALAKAEKGHAELMRRNHMDLMIHKRDKTVHDGIRSEKYSLKACISCHAVLGEDKKPVSIASPKHFCRTCHDYVAVKVDCFQCHASKPPVSVDFNRNLMSELPEKITDYLK